VTRNARADPRDKIQSRIELRVWSALIFVFSRMGIFVAAENEGVPGVYLYLFTSD
jgi:hypothetical protein